MEGLEAGAAVEGLEVAADCRQALQLTKGQAYIGQHAGST